MNDLEKLIVQVRRYNPDADFGKIRKAYNVAQKAHAGQKRLSGDPAFSHPLATALFITEWKLDTDSIVSGLLHDLVEDTNYTLEDVRKEFGEDVVTIVDGVTKISAIKLGGNTEEEFVENLRKMILVMARDLRVVLVKLADRYHNMQTLFALPEDRQKRFSLETLEIYAPLAERLGIGELKGKLEDLAFPYCYPEEYEWVKKLSLPYYKKAEQFILGAKKIILKELERENIQAEVHGRAKHQYSLWRKLLRPELNKGITRIYDLMALRVVVGSIRDCYAALGVVHKLWKPVPSVGVRDYIALPKPNGYRSVHTTVFGLQGRITEIQIRTREMHEEAENGITAHWYYSLQKSKPNMDYATIQKGFFAPDEKLSWVRQLVGWHKEIVDSHEFLEALKFDALHHRIFVFSPKGDVYDLPAEATPVDFAYAVHTQIGYQTIGCKINGKLTPLDFKLQSGQIVEVLVDKNKKKASEGWLGFVLTQRAKQEIKRNLKKV